MATIGKNRQKTTERRQARQVWGTSRRTSVALAQALIDHLPQQIVAGPGQIFDFGDEVGPYPMHATKDQWR